MAGARESTGRAARAASKPAIFQARRPCPACSPLHSPGGHVVHAAPSHIPRRVRSGGVGSTASAGADLLNSPIARAAMGGIAAMAMRQLMNRR